jgi:hypothetical protein
MRTRSVACSGSAANAPPSGAPSVAASTPSAQPSGVPIPTAAAGSGSSAAVVGEWVGVLDCARIVSALKDAKLDASINEAIVSRGLIPDVAAGGAPKDPAHPCAGAVQQRSSLFFTRTGAFGSKDARGFQVDTGIWQMKGDRLVINDQSFGFDVKGDALTLTPPKVDSATCTTRDCRTTAAWALLVAMPGMTWARGSITP